MVCRSSSSKWTGGESKMKTYEYHIQGYHKHYGWETETIELTLEEAQEQLKCYKENVDYPVRILKKEVYENET